MKVLHALTHYWLAAFEVEIKFVSTTTCEKHKDKQKFLFAQYPEMQYLVQDMANMSQDRTHGLKGNTEFIVPWCFLFVAGFPCVSRSSLNKNAAANVGCVRGNSGQTGNGYKMTSDTIRRHKPAIVVLENNPGLLKSDEEGLQDSTYVTEYLSNLGVHDAHAGLRLLRSWLIRAAQEAYLDRFHGH